TRLVAASCRSLGSARRLDQVRGRVKLTSVSLAARQAAFGTTAGSVAFYALPQFAFVSVRTHTATALQSSPRAYEAVHGVDVAAWPWGVANSCFSLIRRLPARQRRTPASVSCVC